MPDYADLSAVPGPPASPAGRIPRQRRPDPADQVSERWMVTGDEKSTVRCPMVLGARRRVLARPAVAAAVAASFTATAGWAVNVWLGQPHLTRAVVMFGIAISIVFLID